MGTCTCIYPENVYGLRSLSGETDHSATASPEAGRFSLPQEFCHLPHLCWQAFSKIISYHCDLLCVSTTRQNCIFLTVICTEEFHCSMRTLDSRVHVLWMQWTKSQGCRSSVEKQGWLGHSLSERAPWPLPGQDFIAFLGALAQGRSSFIIVRQ